MSGPALALVDPDRPVSIPPRRPRRWPWLLLLLLIPAVRLAVLFVLALAVVLAPLVAVFAVYRAVTLWRRSVACLTVGDLVIGGSVWRWWMRRKDRQEVRR